jgi:hypothetical protein
MLELWVPGVCSLRTCGRVEPCPQLEPERSVFASCTQHPGQGSTLCQAQGQISFPIAFLFVPSTFPTPPSSGRIRMLTQPTRFEKKFLERFIFRFISAMLSLRFDGCIALVKVQHKVAMHLPAFLKERFGLVLDELCKVLFSQSPFPHPTL